jgi:hypothetical protein
MLLDAPTRQAARGDDATRIAVEKVAISADDRICLSA